jgi:hypothetical protein
MQLLPPNQSRAPSWERRGKMYDPADDIFFLYAFCVVWIILDADWQGIFTVTLIPGDGIGPEIAESVQRIFEAAKV